MRKGRLEAFSDGVLAIIITIMVLEIKVPAGHDFTALEPLYHVFLSYILSFIYVGIYWNNHHHMLHTAEHVNGKVLWANTHLLFWLSLIPFSTNWIGESHFATVPVAFYGFILAMNGIAYYILAQTLIKLHGKNSVFAKAMGKDFKGKLSVVVYIFGILAAYISPWISLAMYVFVAAIWFIPDRRFENKLMIENHPQVD